MVEKVFTHIHHSNLVPLEVGDLKLLLHLHHVGDRLEEHLHGTNVHLFKNGEIYEAGSILQ